MKGPLNDRRAIRMLEGVGLATPRRAGRKIGRAIRSVGLANIAGKAHAGRRRKRRR